jgi:hypothetical protein
MSLEPIRLLEHVHGHLGWLGAALLVHPAILLRRRERRAHAAVAVATLVVTIASALGAWLYVGYRAELKQGIFISAPTFGLLFERKEHLAFGALMLAWAGCAAYFAAAFSKAGDATRATLRTIAFRSFAFAAALAVIVAILGTVVAVYKSF